MQKRSDLIQSNDVIDLKQVTHILIAGLWTSNKHKLIRHVSDVPLERIDLAAEAIPVELPKLLMGKMQVDSRLMTYLWGAPDHWRHDYVNYLVNIKSILNKRGDHHRVMGMIVVVDSLQTPTSEDEVRLVRLIQSEWTLPYIIVANQPHAPYARSAEVIRAQYTISDNVPILPYDLTQSDACQRALIELMYRTM